MPLYDYRCHSCKNTFESLAKSPDDADAAVCPKCGQPQAEKLIARFKVGGRGDVRETTEFHGCHSSLDLDTHKHGPGCGHGGHGDS